MHHFIYHGNISEFGVRNSMILLSDSMKKGESVVTLHLASLGGDVNAGMMLYNFLKMMPIEVRTHAASNCHSIAVSILLGGSIRTGAPASNFLVHAPRYSEGPSTGQLSPSGKLVAQPFSVVAGWSADDITTRFETAGDFAMTPDKAVELNVISSVVDLRFGSDDEIVTIKVD